MESTVSTAAPALTTSWLNSCSGILLLFQVKHRIGLVWLNVCCNFETLADIFEPFSFIVKVAMLSDSVHFLRLVDEI